MKADHESLHYPHLQLLPALRCLMLCNGQTRMQPPALGSGPAQPAAQYYRQQVRASVCVCVCARVHVCCLTRRQSVGRSDLWM
eukprot:1136861-Pelagomonas_calceolata.AAC.6